MERDYPSDVSDAARIVFRVFCPLLLSLLIIFADGGYAGKLAGFVAGHSARNLAATN